MPASASVVIAGVFLGLLIRRVAPERLFGVALLVMTAGMAAIAAWHATEWQVALAMVPFGLGIGVVLALAPLLITGAVRESETAVAVGMNATVRVIGSVIGGQVAAAILASVTISATDVPAANAFTSVFWMSAAAALLAALAGALIVPRRRGRAL